MILSPGFNSGLPIPIFHEGVLGFSILVQLSVPISTKPGKKGKLNIRGDFNIEYYICPSYFLVPGSYLVSI